jgi:hypothetical protein
MPVKSRMIVVCIIGNFMLDFVRWTVPGRVMLVQFSGTLGIEDVIQMNEKALVLMEEALPPHVNVIVDSTLVTKFAPALMNIKNLRSMLGKHPMVNWHIIVSPDPHPAMRFVGSMVFNLLGARLRVTPTVDEAIQFLEAWESDELRRTDETDS